MKGKMQAVKIVGTSHGESYAVRTSRTTEDMLSHTAGHCPHHLKPDHTSAKEGRSKTLFWFALALESCPQTKNSARKWRRMCD